MPSAVAKLLSAADLYGIQIPQNSEHHPLYDLKKLGATSASLS